LFRILFRKLLVGMRVQKVVLKCKSDVLSLINKGWTQVFIRFTGHDIWAVTEVVKNVLLMWK